MKRVKAIITEIEIDGRDAVQAKCRRCQHTTTSFGTEGPSKRRCLALLREECPEEEENFYVDEDE